MTVLVSVGIIYICCIASLRSRILKYNVVNWLLKSFCDNWFIPTGEKCYVSTLLHTTDVCYRQNGARPREVYRVEEQVELDCQVSSKKKTARWPCDLDRKHICVNGSAYVLIVISLVNQFPILYLAIYSHLGELSNNI